MASTSVHKGMVIPGLDIAPTMDNLEKSRLAYNALPDDCDQPNVTDAVLADLKGLLQKYNVQEKFGYHLVHGHLQLAPGRVMLGQPMAKLDACWTRPTNFKEVALRDVHGHIFVLDSDGEFTPYEYRQGPPAQITANETAFIRAIQSYLVQKNLASLIGIELLGREGTSETCRITGWSLVPNVDGTAELKGNQQHAETVKGPHKVFIDGKALPHANGSATYDIDEEAVIDALRREQVIN